MAQFTSFEDRRLIHHQLRKIGFGGLDDPNLVAHMAFVIEDHDHFRKVLFSIPPEPRKIAYNAMRPHLTFAAKPLDVYEAEMKRIAEQEQWNVNNDNSVYSQPFKVQDINLEMLAQEAIQQMEHEKAKGQLELVCTRCTKAGYFPAPKRKQAYEAAHREGWRWAERNGVMKTYCPEHVPGRLTMTLRCFNCGKEGLQRAWDEQDAYTAARLRGWVIGDAAKCPECAVKKLIIQ